MGWSKKRDSEKDLSPGMERAATKLAGFILLLQTKWAIGMDRLFTRLPAKLRWAVLVCFLMLMLALSGMLIIDGLQGNGRKISIKPDRPSTSVPIKIIPQTTGPAENLPLPILKFRKMLDSLGRTEEGRMKVDSFLRNRPGLMDSVKKIESIYKQHKD